MALEFIHVKLLQYSHTPVFLEAGLRFRVEKKLTITGRIADLTNFEGVSSLFEKEGQVLGAAHDYDDIILNGVSFGAGRIERIAFDGGTMVREEDYTYEITCYEDGNLFNASSGVYQGLTWAEARRIESLEETFDFQEEENGDKTYTHNISVQFTEYSSVSEGTNLAKTLAAVFFNAVSGLGAFLNSYAGLSSAKKLYTETYDIINCECSFTETVVIPRERSGNYSYALNYSLEQDAEGFVAITETLTIKGLSNPRYAGALEGMNALAANSYNRSNSVYSSYNFSTEPLFAQPISKGVSTDKFTGEIVIETQFTNNPSYQNNAIWEYTLEISKDGDGYYNITESGNIIGFGRPLKEKFGNALAFYNSTVEPNIETRVTDFYNDVSGRTLDLIRVSESKGQDEYQGTIEYSVTYTDNNLYSDGAIRKTEASISVSKPVHTIQKYNIFNQKEIVQPQNQSSLGTVSYQIRLRGMRGTGLTTYMSAAKAIINANLPATSDRFISSCQYDFSPQTNDFSLNLQIDYAGSFKAFSSITID